MLATNTPVMKLKFLEDLPGVSGLGTSASPYTGFATTVSADVTGRVVYAQTAGAYYAASTTLSIKASYVTLLAYPGAVYRYTGSGVAISCDCRIDNGGGDISNRYNFVTIEGLHIDGNGTMWKGIRGDSVHHWIVKNCSVYNFEQTTKTSCGYEFLFNIEGEYSSLYCSNDTQESGNMPAIGMKLGDNTTGVIGTTGVPTGGTFTATVTVYAPAGGAATQTTAAINWNDTAAQVAAKIAALTNIGGAGNITITSGGPLNVGKVYLTFAQTLGPVTIVVGANNLTGGSSPAPTFTGYSAQSPQCQCGCSFNVCDIEGCRYYGLWLLNAFSAVIRSSAFATTQSGTGIADIREETGCHDNILMSCDFEGTKGLSINGRNTKLINCNGIPAPVLFDTLSSGCLMHGGTATDGTAGKCIDNGTNNSIIKVDGIRISNISGTGLGSGIYADIYDSYPVRIRNIQVVNGVVRMYDPTTAGTSPSYILWDQLRTGHVQSWQMGQGLIGFQSWALYDATGGVVPIEVKGNAGGTFILNGMTVDTLTVTGNQGITGTLTTGNLTVTGNYGATIPMVNASGNVILDMQSSWTGAGQVYTRYRSSRTAHVQEFHTGIGESSNNSYYIYDVTAGVVTLESFEGGRLNIGASGKNLGFFGGGNVGQQVSGANLTNNVTAGGTTDTIADFSDLTTYSNSAAAIRNDIYQLAKKLKVCHDAMRAYGLLT